MTQYITRELNDGSIVYGILEEFEDRPPTFRALKHIRGRKTLSELYAEAEKINRLAGLDVIVRGNSMYVERGT